MLSMTGFASQTLTIDLSETCRLSCYAEIKSVNSRYCDIICKLPAALTFLEVPLASFLQKKLLRGKVTVLIRFTSENSAFDRLVVQEGRARDYLSAAKKIAALMGKGGSDVLSVADVMNFSDVMSSQREVVDESVVSRFIESFEPLVEKLISTRSVEGIALQQSLSSLSISLREKIEKVDQIASDYYKNIKIEVDRLMLVTKDAENEKTKEQLQLDKLYDQFKRADVGEEMVRLKVHLDSLDTVLKQKNKAVGKRLDFLLQEFLREINTTMAKCSQSEISSLGVDIKVEIEQSREQVQNIV